jgi:hypothetical protein
MLAGGMVIGAPSLVPEAAATGKLFVSADNADFNNTFGGSSVVEVIVKDENAMKTSEAQPEPTVTVGGDTIRMTQGSDGYWYAYIGDSTHIAATHAGNLDGTTNHIYFGIDNAVYAMSNHGSTAITFDSDAKVYWNADVIEDAPTLSLVEPDGTVGLTTDDVGQIGVHKDHWPFVQAFDLKAGEFEIELEQAGANEIVTLDYDSDSVDKYADIVLDRNAATLGASIHMTITDPGLNIDPTSPDYVVFKFDTTSGVNEGVSFNWSTDWTTGSYFAFDNGFDDNGKLKINNNANGAATVLLTEFANGVEGTGTGNDDTSYIAFEETGDNTGIFTNTDDDGKSSLKVNTLAKRGTTATFDYNDTEQSFSMVFTSATVEMDADSIGDEWNSGEGLKVYLYDEDLNLDTENKDKLKVKNGTLVPSYTIGSPLSLTSAGNISDDRFTTTVETTVAEFSKIATADTTTGTIANASATAELNIKTGLTGADWKTYVDLGGYEFMSFDLQNLTTDLVSFSVGIGAGAPANDGTAGACVDLITTNAAWSKNSEAKAALEYGYIGDKINFESAGVVDAACDAVADLIYVNTTVNTVKTDTSASFTVDFFTFSETENHAIYRLEMSETSDNTGKFKGTIEYVMLNQLNGDAESIQATLSTINANTSSNDIVLVDGRTGTDAPRVNYYDVDAEGQNTAVGAQQDAPTHNGTASLDGESYKIADTVKVTVTDQDLNTNNDLIDVYITGADDKVGDNDSSGLHIVDITFNDDLWTGLFETGFTLIETTSSSGIFEGTFQVPTTYNASLPTTGTDIEVNYNDYRDSSGNSTEVGDGASIRANTGSVSFDRPVYPVPYASGEFKLHPTAGTGNIGAGDVVSYITISDADLNTAASGQDSVSTAKLSVVVSRGSLESANLMPTAAEDILETAPDSGEFEYTLKLASGAISNSGVGDAKFVTGSKILQGDIITVTYTDAQDAAGKQQTVTDSSSFDLRNGVLQSDKSVYLIGSDMILTLIEPDFNLDNDSSETLSLDLVEWDSDAATTTLGGKQDATSDDAKAFDPEPSTFRETGDSTGIFQVVIEIPAKLSSSALDRGEKVDLEYTDYGPAGADDVGTDTEDAGLTVYTSNFGATIELDQKVYTWTDKVYITIVAPDHNFDSGFVDEIGADTEDPIKVSTRGNSLSPYKLVESGADTGIFIGEVTLTGMKHDASGNGTNDIDTPANSGAGPTMEHYQQLMMTDLLSPLNSQRMKQL